MEKIGIICEYNPFHNGHLYHIKEIKKMYPDSIIILALTGYFSQRGEISRLSKYDKVRLSINYGINVVIELPTLFYTNSADIFGETAVDALNKAGVEKIVFGSETNDIEKLKEIAGKFSDKKLDDKIKALIKDGTNYPTSLSKALDVNLKSNDILAISYIKAINKINKKIEPITIKRTNDFNDILSNDNIVSAQNIRNKLDNNIDVRKYIPKYGKIKFSFIDNKEYFELLKFRIFTDKHLERFLGVDEGLENKLKSSVLKSTNFDELLDKVKSKRYTTSRLRRMFIHILLGIEKDDIKLKKTTYRILGFDTIGKKYIKKLNSEDLVYKSNGRIREIEVVSSLIYDKITNSHTFKEEILNKPIIKEIKK